MPIFEHRPHIDYGSSSFPPFMTPDFGGHGGNYYGGRPHRHGRDDHGVSEFSKRRSDYVYRRIPEHESRPEKSPRFRESGDSDDNEDEKDPKKLS
ncbi:uncharacterized protein [Primulina eburnea]|uniref:uncharacterized protein isoform X3 n=1 Tax=Primulina eburnea TaxID=1245227 RepID=UPI003C6C73E9